MSENGFVMNSCQIAANGPEMNACLKFSEKAHDLRPQPVDRATLSLIRFAARACRASARLDLERACAIIDATPDTALHALISALPDALRQPFRVYGLHEVDLTFDERWLLSVIDAMRRNDMDSVWFLVTRRVPLHSRRWLIVLLRRVTDAIDQTTPSPHPKEEARYGTTRN